MSVSWRIILFSFGVTTTAYVVSFFGHSISLIGEIAAVVLVCGYAIVLWRAPVVALAILCAELAATSFGRIFPVPWDTFLSVRSIMILLTLIPSVFALFDRGTRDLLRPYYWPLLAVAGVLGWGTFSGFLHGHPTAAVINDANGYLTFFILPFVVRTLSVNNAPRTVISAVLGAVCALSALTLLLFLFFLIPSTDTILRDFVYRWVRDVRLGEITPRLGPPGTRRIFLQSQLWAVAGAIWLALAVGWKQIKTPPTAVVIILFISALWIGMSRTFFVALAVTIVSTVLYFGFMRLGVHALRFFALISAGLVISAVCMYAISFGVWGGKATTRLITANEPAIVSRWSLLDGMNNGIRSAPLFGQGFGSTLTYITSDPRLLTETPGGQIQTSAFEWGWHDLWLKMGAFGPAAFLWLFFTVIYKSWRGNSTVENVWAGGLAICVGVAHLFSPWLNHPVGIGLLLLAVGIQANTANKKPQRYDVR